MRIALTTVATIALAACATMPESTMAQDQVDAADVLIRNVTVIDPQSGTTRPSSDVFLDGGRIVEIADSGVSTRLAADTVEAEGHFLIPGLMNMHTHSSFGPVHQPTLQLMLANGVTGIREMGSDCVSDGGFSMCIDTMFESRARIEAGELTGPRILQISSAKIDSNRPEDPTERQAAYRPVTPEDSRATVAFMAERGAEFLKTGDEFMPEAFAAFAEAAQEQGLGFGGHIPPYLSAGEVAAMGMTSIEHARDLPLDCSTYGAEYRAAVLAALTTEDSDWPDRMQMPARSRDTFDEELCGSQLASLVEHGTYYVPTHLTREMDYRAGDEDYRNDPRFDYIMQLQRRGWFRDMDRTVERLGPIRDDLEDFFQLGLRTTGMAHEAGVRVMAGTDTNDTMVFPGFSLHDELRHLVAAGLTPMEALQAATSVPAEYLGRASDFGGVSEGRMADLVLLRANPLSDIANTTQIEAVFFDGRVHDREDLDAILANVRSLVAELNATMGPPDSE